MNRTALTAAGLFLYLCLLFILPGWSEEWPVRKTKNSERNSRLADPLKKDKKLQLTVQKVVEYLLTNNYDVKTAILEYKGASNPLLSFESQYDLNLMGSSRYGTVFNPNVRTQYLQGKSTTYQYNYFGLNKSFNSGTQVSVGLNSNHEHTNTSYFPFSFGSITYPMKMGGPSYTASVSATLSQELLKNCFGVTDRMTEQKISNAVKLQKGFIRLNLSRLLVNALVGYWNVAIAEENLRTSEINLKSTTDIRNLVQSKTRIGLSESEELLDWNSRLMQSSNQNERNRKILFDAKLALVRTLNIEDSGTDIEVGKTFTTGAPDVELEQAMKDAYLKREDWNNQRIALKNAELDYKIASNGSLPSLKLKLGVGSKDYSAYSYTRAWKEVNPEYSAGLEFSYPLFDMAARVKMREARLGYAKQETAMKELELSIRDEVRSLVKQCEVSYKIYEQTKKQRQYAQNYYNRVLEKWKLGKYNQVQLKMALDAYIGSRLGELSSLVEYNIALIQRDLARNVIFENLGIDIHAILKRVEN